MSSSNGMEERGSGSTCFRAHLNQLWSVWYGLGVSGLQAYLALVSARRLLQWYDYDWSKDERGREVEAGLALTLLAGLLLPFFAVASLCKVGNLANDGVKLGRHWGSCSVELGPTPRPDGGLRAVWLHGGPTAAFLHLLAAFCLLLSNLLLEAKLIKSEILPKEDVWKTDLDFLVSSPDRFVVLNVINPGSDSNSSANSSGAAAGAASRGLLLLPGQDEEKIGPVSIEFFNYALALAVYSVRYPAVFWNTNKVWGAIFSFQLFINGIQSLFIYAGVCILYKVHVVGPTGVLPILPMKFGNHFFLLNPQVTLALLVLTTCLVLSSSLVLYFYGYGRYNAFLNHEKACKMISVESRDWGYLTHCAALCVLLAITVVEGPLLVDLAVIYKSNSDPTVISSVIAAAFHVFIWVSLWLVLTLKQKWNFKLRVTVGRAVVKSARSIKLVTDVELASATSDPTAPLLVLASGRAYAVSDASPKKTIINVIHKSALERKARLQEMSSSTPKDQMDEEQIYWLRPKPISPKNSPDSEVSDHVSWQKKAVQKPKVTFDQSVIGPKDEVEGDDGDYARLRELPISTSKLIHQEEIYIKASKVSKVGYGRVEAEKLTAPTPPVDYEDPSPLLTPELPLPPPPDPPVTPRCLLRADSGVPNDLTPRSDSELSGSPPDHSETSSGVHSNSSRESNNNATGGNGGAKLEQGIPENINCHQWNGNLLPRDLKPTNPGEVVICRRIEAEPIPLPINQQDKFGRSTNMKMTSFTDGQSATLPHFPTSQQIGVPYPHCSTMPLPPPVAPPPSLIHPTPIGYPRHTTIPSHHNGVRLFSNNIYAKRPIIHRYPQHHSFPQLMNPTAVKFNLRQLPERDSANFSMASSAESDTYHS